MGRLWIPAHLRSNNPPELSHPAPRCLHDLRDQHSHLAGEMAAPFVLTVANCPSQASQGGLVPAQRTCGVPGHLAMESRALDALLPPAARLQDLAKTNCVFVARDDPAGHVPYLQLGEL